jgi:hypothetical protein
MGKPDIVCGFAETLTPAVAEKLHESCGEAGKEVLRQVNAEECR